MGKNGIGLTLGVYRLTHCQTSSYHRLFLLILQQIERNHRINLSHRVLKITIYKNIKYITLV